MAISDLDVDLSENEFDTQALLTTSFDSLTQMSTHGSDQSHELKKIPPVFEHYLIPDDASSLLTCYSIN